MQVVITFRKVWRKFLRKSELRVHMVNCACVCVYIRGSPDPHCYTLESDWPELDRSATCVIAQQYSSATFVSSRFH